MFLGYHRGQESLKFEKVISRYCGFLFEDKDYNPLVAMH